MSKKNPIEQLLSRKKHKKQKNKASVPTAEFYDEDGNFIGSITKGREMKTEEEIRKEKIRKAIDAKVAQYKVRKDEEELVEEEEEESVDVDEIKEMLAEVLAILRGEAEGEAASEESEEVEEFPDADEVKAIRALASKYGGLKGIKKRLIAKEEEKHKPKEATESVDTGKDEREVEEDDFGSFEEQGNESPKVADRNVLSEKANYKNEYGKPKELPEKSQLSQKVIPQDSIPDQSSVSRTTSKQTTGKSMEVGAVASVEKGETEKTNSDIADILKGKKKARDVIGIQNGGVFGW
jgi:hypothetical protein